MIYKVDFPHRKEFLRKTGDNFNESDRDSLEPIFEKYPNAALFHKDHAEFFIICGEIQIITIKTIMSKYRLKFDVFDITKDVLYGNMDLMEYINKNIEVYEEDAFTLEEFKSHYEIYIKRNRTIDLVLDKINDLGIQNLSENDLKVLKNENNF